jgi:hypothetical protein
MENTGACVVRQLCICFEERARGTTRADHTWKWTKTLTLEMANACFDEAFRELGFQEGVAPYSGTGGWREQGVSYEMFEFVVKKLGACCYVYHNSDLAFFIDGRKEGKFVAPDQRQPCLAGLDLGRPCVHVHGQARQGDPHVAPNTQRST